MNENEGIVNRAAGHNGIGLRNLRVVRFWRYGAYECVAHWPSGYMEWMGERPYDEGKWMNLGQGEGWHIRRFLWEFEAGMMTK